MDRRSERQIGSSKGGVMNYQKEFPNKLSFDDKGRVFVPSVRRGQVQRRWDEPSSSTEGVAQYNPYAVLGGIFQDVIETIAQKERVVVSSKGKVINN